MSAQEPADSRISVSLSTLRAELGQLELRLVDRLNAALSNKADRSVQDQHSLQLADVTTRLTGLEQSTIKRDGPVVQEVALHAQKLDRLESISGYRKWLLAQGVALIAVGIPVLIFAIDKATS